MKKDFLTRKNCGWLWVVSETLDLVDTCYFCCCSYWFCIQLVPLHRQSLNTDLDNLFLHCWMFLRSHPHKMHIKPNGHRTKCDFVCMKSIKAKKFKHFFSTCYIKFQFQFRHARIKSSCKIILVPIRYSWIRNEWRTSKIKCRYTVSIVMNNGVLWIYLKGCKILTVRPSPADMMYPYLKYFVGFYNQFTSNFTNTFRSIDMVHNV